MKAKQVEEMISTGLADAQVQVESDAGGHFAALVIATEFAGLGKIQRRK